MSKHIINLIKQGEHQTLDFKHSITDSKKIARSLVAFANTLGGTLLIGVKDNGSIVGIDSEEEYYMIEAAAQIYCKPEIPFVVTKWTINGKAILEVIVNPAKHKPVKAPDKNGDYKAFVRVNDENIVASPIQLKIWKTERHRKSIMMVLSEKENALFDYFKTNPKITVGQYSRLAFISRIDAENTLIDLTVLGLILHFASQDEEYFMLSPQ
ncbi:MAG: ATP-binding protein [Bacteroidales bacterium]|nr:MAG: ATP-binding protein [Bacteroidales bacterium]